MLLVKLAQPRPVSSLNHCWPFRCFNATCRNVVIFETTLNLLAQSKLTHTYQICPKLDCFDLANDFVGCSSVQRSHFEFCLSHLVMVLVLPRYLQTSLKKEEEN